MQNYHYSFPSFNQKNKKKIYWLLFAFTILVLILILLLKLMLTLPQVNNVRFVFQSSSSYNDLVLTQLKNKMLEEKWRAILGPQNVFFWMFKKQPLELNTLPFVENLNWKTLLFQNTVNLSFTSRNTFGILCENDSPCYAFDENGTIFETAPNVTGPLVLKIVDQTGRNFILGEKILPSDEWIKNFKEIISDLKEANFGISEIQFNDINQAIWKVKIGNGPDLIFSFNFVPEELPYILKNLSTKINFLEVSYIDFSVPNRIYYK
jgi:cell division septal protein FtsQ